MAMFCDHPAKTATNPPFTLDRKIKINYLHETQRHGHEQMEGVCGVQFAD